MNLMILAYNITPEDGGIERYLNILIKEYSRQKVELELHLIPSVPQSFFSKIKIILKIFFGPRKKSPDYIHCGHLHLLPLSFILSLLLNCPIILYLYGSEFWGQKLKKYQKYSQNIKSIVTISEFSIDQLMGQRFPGIRREDIIYIPPVLDQDSFIPKWSEILERRKNGNKFILLTVARLSSLEKHKGHENVLQALSLLQKGNHFRDFGDWIYYIVGDGDDRGRLEELVHRLNLGERVKFFGRVSDQKLVEIYKESDLYIMPSRSVISPEEIIGEGFGIVFLEAMCFGLPLIGPDIGGPTDIIIHGENGFQVDPLSPPAIAEKILLLYKDPALRRKMGKNAYDSLHHRFTMAQLPAYMSRLHFSKTAKISP